MVLKRSLGRGLSELLTVSRPAEIKANDGKTLFSIQPSGQLPIDSLQPGKFQPRRNFSLESLQELADSIQAQGLLQPLLVRAVGAQRYEIIAGERRWRAAQLARLEQVPVLIRDISDHDAIAVALIENIQREDLNIMEQVLALKRLGDEFDLTHEEIAQAVGKSRVTISNLLRLLNLESRVREMLENGMLDMGHARAILSLNSAQQLNVAKEVVAKQLSVRQTENLVRQYQMTTVEVKKSIKRDPDVIRFQKLLSDKLGAMVKIEQNQQGKGKLIIRYHSLEELEGILEHIR